MQITIDTFEELDTLVKLVGGNSSSNTDDVEQLLEKVNQLAEDIEKLQAPAKPATKRRRKKTEEPKVEEPKVEEPKVEEPKVEEPNSGEVNDAKSNDVASNVEETATEKQHDDARDTKEETTEETEVDEESVTINGREDLVLAMRNWVNKSNLTGKDVKPITAKVLEELEAQVADNSSDSAIKIADLYTIFENTIKIK